MVDNHHTADSSGSTTSSHQGSLPSERIPNKLRCSLDDVIFGQSLGEGNSIEFIVSRRVWQRKSVLAQGSSFSEVCYQRNEKGRHYQE